MISFLISSILFILIVIHGQMVFKKHHCPSLVINHQVEKSIGMLFSENKSLETKKINFKHLQKCHHLIKNDHSNTSSNNKRKVFILFEGKFQK